MKKLLHSFVLMFAVLAVPVVANAQSNADVNGDGEVTIADINCVIEAILDGTASAAADVNSDGEVTLADVNAVVNTIVGGSDPTPGPGGLDGFSDETIALLKECGMNIYTGVQPPMVEGVYAMEPVAYIANYGWDDEEEDEIMTKMILNFKEQDGNKILFAGGAYYLDLESGEVYPDGDNEFMEFNINGFGNKFTISYSYENEDPEGLLGFLLGGGIVISGEMSNLGIRNLQFAYILFGTDEDGNPASICVIYGDQDGMSYPTEWPEWPEDDWINAADYHKFMPLMIPGIKKMAREFSNGMNQRG